MTNPNLSARQFEDTTMRVGDLPFPDTLQTSTQVVAKLRRSIRRRGYTPGEGDAPITVLRREGKPDKLSDGNHRTAALKTAGGLTDMQVPVRITNKPPDWWKPQWEGHEY